jgi:hypothetical protein
MLTHVISETLTLVNDWDVAFGGIQRFPVGTVAEHSPTNIPRLRVECQTCYGGGPLCLVYCVLGKTATLMGFSRDC